MSLTITKFKMWKDPGYTHRCVEAPPAGSWKLPAADYTLAAGQTLRPHKNSTLTELNLPLSFTQTFGMSYLYLEATDGSGSVKLFGWIDSITQRSTSAEGVTIRWSPDYWRTYSGVVTFGAGQITKCSDSSYKRPYRTQPRYWKTSKSDMTPLSDSVNATESVIVYVIASFTVNGVSQIRYFEFPSRNAGTTTFTITGDSDTYGSLPLTLCYKGLIDELLTSYCSSLSPSPSFQIIGCYASRLRSGMWTPGTSWTRSIGTGIKGAISGYGTYAMVEVTSFSASHSIAFSPSIQADDMTQYVITDYWGNIVGYLPYGISVKGIYLSLDIGVNGAYEKLIFDSDAFDANKNEMITSKATKALGLEFCIPCVTIPITENQWSSYLLGGQRDYDITSARIANDQKAISGIESTFQAGIGGAIAGSSAGVLGMIGGLLGGLIGEGIFTAVNYGLGENFNDQLQDAADRLYSNQQNGILLIGGSRDWYDRNNLQNKPWGCYLIKMSADSVSASEYSADITNNGYDVDIPTSSTSSFVSAGGPLRITQLVITGNAPPQAKTDIKNMLERGIRIVENNPSGVAP